MVYLLRVMTPTTERAVADPVLHCGADPGVTGAVVWAVAVVASAWCVVGFAFGFVLGFVFV